MIKFPYYRSAWTQDFLIKKYNTDGVFQSAFYYPITGVPFDLNDYTEKYRYNVRDIKNAFSNNDNEIPKTVPIVDDMIVDDKNRIWVSIPMDPQREMLEWWILNETGS
ncbi:MAG: hypothetical protein WEA58_06410 [Balneolaceae bacterium]